MLQNFCGNQDALTSSLLKDYIWFFGTRQQTQSNFDMNIAIDESGHAGLTGTTRRRIAIVINMDSQTKHDKRNSNFEVDTPIIDFCSMPNQQ